MMDMQHQLVTGRIRTMVGTTEETQVRNLKSKAQPETALIT